MTPIIAVDGNAHLLKISGPHSDEKLAGEIPAH